MENARAPLFPALAPLTAGEAVHLASYRVRHTARTAGRPRGKALDITTRYELRLLEALEALIPVVAEARQQVYQLMDGEVRAGTLSQSWLLRTLSAYTPRDKIVYPQRLIDWQRSGVLRYTEKGQPEPQCAAGLLIARKIDPRNNGWLPTHLSPLEMGTSWACLMQAAPGDPVLPFPLPLPQGARPEPPTSHPALCWTPWKGARWLGWVEVEGGAIGWFPAEQVSYDLLRRWEPALPLRDDPPAGQSLTALSAGALDNLARTRLPLGPPRAG